MAAGKAHLIHVQDIRTTHGGVCVEVSCPSGCVRGYLWTKDPALNDHLRAVVDAAVAAHAAAHAEPVPEPVREPLVPCPEGFHWMGGSWAHCEECDLPAWEHAGMAMLAEGAGPFSNEWVLRPWEPGKATKIARYHGVTWPPEEKWRVPFTDDQVAALNRYQRTPGVHPYTCGRKANHPPLSAGRDGWTCSECDYRQSWAHPIEGTP